MIITKNSIEHLNLIESGKILSEVHALISTYIQEGISTIQLNEIAEEFINKNNAAPSFKNYKPPFSNLLYEHTLCTSINDIIVHGIPSNKKLKNGDIISIDCGVQYNNMCSDSAYTYIVGNNKTMSIPLYHAEQSLYEGISAAKVGNKIGHISSAIQNYCNKNKLNIYPPLTGHSLGFIPHEEPFVPNIGNENDGDIILEGLILAIEPMVGIGCNGCKMINDWEIATSDKSISFHFEHTIVIWTEGVEFITNFNSIKK